MIARSAAPSSSRKLDEHRSNLTRYAIFYFMPVWSQSLATHFRSPLATADRVRKSCPDAVLPVFDPQEQTGSSHQERRHHISARSSPVEDGLGNSGDGRPVDHGDSTL